MGRLPAALFGGKSLRSFLRAGSLTPGVAGEAPEGIHLGTIGEAVFQSVSVGAAGSKALEVLGPRMLARNFEPGFYVEHFIKDMGIALEEAKKMGLSLPGLALANQLYLALQAQGYGRKGTQALLLALESLSGVKR